MALYARSALLPREFKEEAGLLLPFVTYFQDPFVAKNGSADEGLDEEVLVPWEPGLADGPTSSRFAIVDYNADTGELEPPAVWNENVADVRRRRRQIARQERGRRRSSSTRSASGRSCSARWRSSRTRSALGRRDPLGVRGQPPDRRAARRLRRERLLRPRQQVAAVLLLRLDGETPSTPACPPTSSTTSSATPCSTASGRCSTRAATPQTGAFHEFMGDLTAILLTLQEQRRCASSWPRQSGGKFAKADDAVVARRGVRQGGERAGRTCGRRSTRRRWPSVANETSPHRLSRGPDRRDVRRPDRDSASTIRSEDDRDAGRRPARRSARVQAGVLCAPPIACSAWRSSRSICCRPVDVTFRDYALAVCRSQQLADPLDPQGYYGMLIEVFRKREILIGGGRERAEGAAAISTTGCV